MGKYIKETGIKIFVKGKDINNIQIQTCIKEILLKVNNMDMEFINGNKDKYIKVNGKMEINKELEYGNQ